MIKRNKNMPTPRQDVIMGNPIVARVRVRVPQRDLQRVLNDTSNRG